MPYFTLSRNYTLSTTKGHSVNFKKNERTWVPAGIIQEALSIGAVPEEAVDVLGAEKEVQSITEKQRETMIFEAFEKLLLRSMRGDFTASGMPHPRKLAEMVGFDVMDKEREALWRKYNDMKKTEAEEQRDN